ncbi:GumC family protein [Phreatobacter sp.]|uniref:GumC family protein n=1 Tax=Phreatobacter sp. TaxID=1966341 RepID=UPI003F72FA93
MNRTASSNELDARGAQGGELDLGALGRAIWDRRHWIVLPTLLALGLSAIAVNLVQPTYRSEARILVESGETSYTRPESERGAAPDRSAIDQEAVLSQVQVVLSRDVAKAVVEQLDLARNPEFDPALRRFNPVRQALVMLGLADDPLRMTAEERVLRSYQSRLTAYQVDRSRVIAIQFESGNPELAARAANAIADRLIEAQRTNKRDQTRSAGQWLGTEVEQLRRKVVEAEGRVESFRARADLFTGANNISLTAQQLADVNGQIAAARAQQTDAQTRSRLLRDFLRTRRPIEAGDVVNSEIIRRLNEQRAAVTAQLAEQSSTLGPRHPRIAELRAQLANLETQVRLEAEKLVRVLENDARIAGARVESLQQDLDQVKQQASRANEQEIQLRVLEREAKSLRDQLEALLSRYRDASARESAGAIPADARVVSQAVVSNLPAFPRKIPTILIATLGTLLLTLGCVTTLALLSGPPAAAAPRMQAAEPARFADVPEATGPEPAAPEYPDSIAALAGMLVADGREARRTLVVPTAAGLVATGVAIALGRELSRTGRAVVMVDLDPSTAALSALAGPRADGLADYAAGAIPLAAAIHADPQSRAHIVPLGRSGEARAPEPDIVAFAIDALSSTYDSVIVLSGELSGEAADLAALADEAVVVAETEAHDPAVIAAFERLTDAGLEPVVVMLAAAEPATVAAAA